jgi:GTP cyclohydrolase I
LLHVVRCETDVVRGSRQYRSKLKQLAEWAAYVIYARVNLTTQIVRAIQRMLKAAFVLILILRIRDSAW